MSFKIQFSVLLIALYVANVLAHTYSISHDVPVYPTRLSSQWLPNDHFAQEALDRNMNTYCHTNLELEPYFEGDFTATATVGLVEVYNRKDCLANIECASRLRAFYVFLSYEPFSPTATVADLLATPNVFAHFVQTNSTNPNDYAYWQIYAPDVTARHIRITLATGQPDYLNMAEVYVHQMSLIPVTSALGSSNMWGHHPVSDVHDNDINTFYLSESEPKSNPWVEIQFANQLVCKVVIWNRQDCCAEKNGDCCNGDLSPFIVAYKTGKFTELPPSRDLAEQICSEPGVQCNSVNNGNQRYYVITSDVTNPLSADRIRLFQETGSWLSVSEVKAYACIY